MSEENKPEDQKPPTKQAEEKKLVDRPSQREYANNYEEGSEVRSSLESKHSDHSVSFPLEDVEETEVAMSNAKILQLEKNKDTVDWVQALETASSSLMRLSMFSEVARSGESEFLQRIPYEGKNIGAGRPKASSTPGGVLSGEAAILKANAVMGLGGTLQVPLWHTGIWVSLKAPANSAVLELQAKIAHEKVSLGKMSSGMLFSNVSAFTKKHVVDFVLSHVYDSTLNEFTVESLSDTILFTDYPQLIWGIVNLMYPRGFELTQPCTVSVGECNHVEKTTLNVGRISWTDNGRLNEQQRKHMFIRNRKVTVNEIEAYQQAGDWTTLKDVEINDRMTIDITVPTITKYLEGATEWVESICKMTEDTLGQKLRGEARDRYITLQSNTMSIRHFSQWFTRVSITVDPEEGPEYMEGRDTIDRFMTHLSSDEEIAKKINKETRKAISTFTFNFIGIPGYTCRKCKGNQVPEGEKHNLIPLDVEQVFFTLADQSLQTVSRITGESWIHDLE